MRHFFTHPISAKSNTSATTPSTLPCLPRARDHGRGYLQHKNERERIERRATTSLRLLFQILHAYFRDPAYARSTSGSTCLPSRHCSLPAATCMRRRSVARQSATPSFRGIWLIGVIIDAARAPRVVFLTCLLKPTPCEWDVLLKANKGGCAFAPLVELHNDGLRFLCCWFVFFVFGLSANTSY